MKENKIVHLETKKSRFSFVEDFMDSVPELEEMSAEDIQEFRGTVEDVIEKLDTLEPKNENSDTYADWAEYHEDLEDLLDEIQDILDDM